MSSTKALAELLIMFVGQATIICCLDTKPSMELPAGGDDKTLNTSHSQTLFLLGINFFYLHLIKGGENERT